VSRQAPGRLVLLGHPVAHSLSPAFQNAALRAAGVSLRYEALDVTPDALPGCLSDLAAVHASGNVTIPHKEAVAGLCTRLEPLALRTGAVNTFWHAGDGTLVGDNTDVGGFEAMADSLGVRREGAVVACLGAGGAAAAVCAAVESWAGAKLYLLSRRDDRSRALASRFPDVARVPSSFEVALEEATVVVNATPIGLKDSLHPLAPDELPRDACVMDLVYRPGETAWVRAARTLGHSAADGREMLLQQGALAFSRWFGFPPDLAVMRRALDEATA
jgi:shikimate dehydrogenase